MKKFVHVFPIFALLFICVSFASGQSGLPGIKVIEINHGLYEVEVAGKQKAENALTQSMNILSAEKLLFRTDSIVADIGKTFGVEFNVNTGNNAYIIPLRIVWEFPKPMKNPHNGKIYKTSEVTQQIISNQTIFHSYTLEYDYEFVEGLWNFKVYFNNTEIFKHSFWVMLPL